VGTSVDADLAANVTPCGSVAFRSGSGQDIIEAILTVPAAIAVRARSASTLVRGTSWENSAPTAGRLLAALPEARRYLGRLAVEAWEGAIAHAQRARRLV
jgi:hypothetical protein